MNTDPKALADRLREHIEWKKSQPKRITQTAVEFLEEVEAALRAQPSPSDWRDISTAPRDGTHIIACSGPYSQHFHFQQRPPMVVHYWTNPGEEGFYLSNGIVEHSYNSHAMTFTHWKPLGQPPMKDEVAASPSDAGAVREALAVVDRYIEAAEEARAAWTKKSEYELRDQAISTKAALRNVRDDIAAIVTTGAPWSDTKQILDDLHDAEMTLNGIASGYHAECQTELSFVMAADAQKAIDYLKSARAKIKALASSAGSGTKGGEDSGQTKSQIESSRVAENANAKSEI